MPAGYSRKPISERFWQKVEVRGPDECWPWRGKLNTYGYGELKADCKRRLAHRLLVEWANGPIPSGHVVRHKCDNPSCVNLWHLELGTQADNVADRVARGRCAQGERQGRAKLSWETVAGIRARSAESGAALAREFGVSQSTISEIRAGKRWKTQP